MLLTMAQEGKGITGALTEADKASDAGQHPKNDGQRAHMILFLGSPGYSQH